MRRADRLFQIVQYLRGGRLTTARQLAERLEVSDRTIYRDIADLIGSGVPIDGEAGIGYLMRAGYDLPPLMFNRDEIVALVVGARMLKAWGGAQMAAAAEEALIKIAAVLPDAERERANRVPVHAITMGQMSDELRARLDEFDHAVEGRLRLKVTYQDLDGAESCRDIRPLGLVFWGKVWTLVAWCELRNDFRMFRVDRFSATGQNGTFRPEKSRDLAAFYTAMKNQPRRASRNDHGSS